MRDGHGGFRLSIVLPHYNHGELVAGALGSVAAQSSPPDELIVVDDGSNAANLSALQRALAGQDDLVFLRHAQNQGVSAACHTGIQRAHGDFIAFMAADDRLALSAIEEVRKALPLAPEAGIVFSDPADLGEGSEARIHSFALSERPRFFTPDEVGRLLRRNFFFLRTENVWFNAAALRRMDGFDDRLRWHADLFAAYALALEHGAIYIPEALSFFRHSDSSYSTGRSGPDQIHVLRAWLAKTREPSTFDRRKAFREAAVLPEYSAKAAYALRADPHFVTPRLIARLVTRSVWNQLRPILPWRFRRALRRMSGNYSTMRLRG